MRRAASPVIRVFAAAALSAAFFALPTRAADAPPAPARPAAPTTAPTTAPEELIDNPQFAHWSKFEIGSSATLSTEILTGGQKVSTVSTNKLLEKNGEKVIVEISGTMNIAGQNNELPPQKQDIPAQIAKRTITQSATEKVDAAGKTFECKVYEMSNDESGQPGAKAKVWLSDEVPGGVVKLEATLPNGSVTGSLTKFEAK